jgi:sec-independent protein translocase protein TatC
VRIPRLPDPNEPDVFEEMTLQEHLEELRDRILHSALAVAAAFVLGILLSRRLLSQIAEQANVEGGLDIQSPTDTITIYFKIAMYIAIAITSPVLVYEFVAFMAPGLTKREKRILYTSLPFVSILLVGGASYAYFFAAPRALDFLKGFGEGIFSWDPDGNQVINFYLTLMIGLGFSFQLPVIMFILARMRIIGPKKMAQYRRFAFIGILILSAIITPSTDPINMGVVALPLVLLYEVGIWLARAFGAPDEPAVSGS